jgi:hypothetical protein
MGKDEFRISYGRKDDDGHGLPREGCHVLMTPAV